MMLFLRPHCYHSGETLSTLVVKQWQSSPPDGFIHEHIQIGYYGAHRLLPLCQLIVPG